MEIYHGTSILAKTAIGKIKVIENEALDFNKKKIDDVESETQRLIRAGEKAHKELKQLYDKTLAEAGEENAFIFKVHDILIDDTEYLEPIKKIIKDDKVCAEYAIAKTGDDLIKRFDSIENSYLKARSSDIADVSRRLIRLLNAKEKENKEIYDSMIIVADDFLPGLTVGQNFRNVLAFVTKKGSKESHAAILARSMNIPAVVGADIDDFSILDNKTAIVDGNTGTVYIEPDLEFIKKTKEKIEDEKRRKMLIEYFSQKSGEAFNCGLKLFSEIMSEKEAEKANSFSDGAGLFRTEYIIGKDDIPSEDEQFKIYKETAEALGKKECIIRTFDFGGDKFPDLLNIDVGKNAFYSQRGAGAYKNRPDIFITQIKALFRASLYGNISILYPMITTKEELRQIKEMINTAVYELNESNIKYRIPKTGVMIETPAAVMSSDLLAKEVDFLAIGTNDLFMYTMALDRQSPLFDLYYDYGKYAMYKMIEIAVKNAKKEGKTVGICGFMAADTDFTKAFANDLKVDYLCMNFDDITKVRKKIEDKV